jgi:hypothetical protein
LGVKGREFEEIFQALEISLSLFQPVPPPLLLLFLPGSFQVGVIPILFPDG